MIEETNTTTGTTLNAENPDVVEPDNSLPPLTLAELPEGLRDAMKRAGWAQLAEVQAKTLPYLRAGRELMVQAQTGSGKTGAFILPILERVNTQQNATQALILVPTRELAQQVAKEAETLAGDSGLRTVAVYGGTSYKPQIDAFQNGVHLVVGTPGRVIDHLLKRNLKLDNIKVVVYDEADRMMSMGFYPDMVEIHEYLPQDGYTSWMFSATLPAHIMRLANQFLRKPEFLSLSRDNISVEDIRHIYYLTPGMEKDRLLVRVIEMENPSQAIIFCETKDRVNYVNTVLQRFGYNADLLSSDLNQTKREKIIERMREGKLRFLVATDVASRGIDIPELSHVFQYEPPEDLEAYIHRSGRTGRQGASGVAITLVNYTEEKLMKRIAAMYEIKFETPPRPTDEDVETLVAQRLTGRLEAQLRERDKLQVERMQRFEPLVREMLENEDGLALITMLLDDAYHDWMHHPPELPPITSGSAKKEGSSPKKDGGGSRDKRSSSRRRRR